LIDEIIEYLFFGISDQIKDAVDDDGGMANKVTVIRNKVSVPAQI
jgi:hypothetical protein